jgi:FkbM family methyltransferase
VIRTYLAVFLRGLLRRLRLTAYAKSAGLRLGLPGEDDLERAVDDFLTATIRPGDVVWDVGANRGRHTRLLSSLVGRDGLVVSIEPEAANMGHLASAVWSAPNVTLVNAALSDTDGTETLIMSTGDKAGRTHSLSGKRPAPAAGQAVQVFRGDTLVQQRRAPQPAFIMIDVEGAEDRVVAGLSATLRSAMLKDVLIEIHFGALDKDGRAFAPVQIERRMRSLGLATRWLDRSHLVACRQPL